MKYILMTLQSFIGAFLEKYLPTRVPYNPIQTFYCVKLLLFLVMYRNSKGISFASLQQNKSRTIGTNSEKQNACFSFHVVSVAIWFMRWYAKLFSSYFV